jgi:hypothetical protein
MAGCLDAWMAADRACGGIAALERGRFSLQGVYSSIGPHSHWCHGATLCVYPLCCCCTAGKVYKSSTACGTPFVSKWSRASTHRDLIERECSILKRLQVGPPRSCAHTHTRAHPHLVPRPNANA